MLQRHSLADPYWALSVLTTNYGSSVYMQNQACILTTYESFQMLNSGHFEYSESVSGQSLV